MSRTKRRLIFYAITGAFIVIAWELPNVVHFSYVVDPSQTPPPSEEWQLNALLELNHLLTTLSTGLLAAIGFILIRGRKPRAGIQLWPALASTFFVFLSMFFGYQLYQSLLWMLAQPPALFSLYNPNILYPRQAQFYSFLVGVFFFSDFMIQYLYQKERT